jgi:hypothetical protein
MRVSFALVQNRSTGHVDAMILFSGLDFDVALACEVALAKQRARDQPPARLRREQLLSLGCTMTGGWLVFARREMEWK